MMNGTDFRPFFEQFKCGFEGEVDYSLCPVELGERQKIDFSKIKLPKRYYGRRIRVVDKERRVADSKHRIYERRAPERGLVFELNREETFELFTGNCEYCGSSPHPEKLNGIDRVDNAVGYVRGNVVSSCSACNYMKHVMSKEDFFRKVREIAKHQSE